jgi:hypothetical protein
MIAQGYATSLVVSLMPTESDYSWIPNAPTLNQTSQVIVGDYNISDFINPTSNQLIVQTNADNMWVFNVTVGIGLTNTTGENVTEYYTTLTNSTYNQTLIETAFPGISLGASQYTLVTTLLNNISYNLWQCKNTRGGYCSAPVWCETFNGDEYSSWNYTDYGFKFQFTSNSTYYVKVPLFAFMRNGPDPQKPTCNMLIFRQSATNNQSPWIILGDAFLQQFFA